MIFFVFLTVFLFIVCIKLWSNKKIYKKQQTELNKLVYNLKNTADSNLKELFLYKEREEIFKETFDRLNNSLDLYKKKASDLDRLLYLYPYLNSTLKNDLDLLDVNSIEALEADTLKQSFDSIEIKKQLEFYKNTHSNLKIIPYMAEIMADWESYQIEVYAKKLDWGSSIEREKKVKSIREIRKEVKEIIKKNKEAQYQLAYLLELFPSLEEVIETDYKDIEIINKEDYLHCDDIRDYISNDEWLSLSPTERNQLALDRYIKSHKKTKWQIGRDYELYIGYLCSQKGLSVDFFGSYMGLEDLGRDIIAKKGEKTYIIQCKYWSSVKMIHEKHIAQLYGTTISYCIENNESKKNVKGVFVTNIKLSETAKKFASYLKIKVIENLEAGEYPRIKCNIGHDEFGVETKIYHLPMDQQYDRVKICKKGEFYAMTVKEAEEKGFRRANKYYDL